jgi:hypothetical protein
MKTLPMISELTRSSGSLESPELLASASPLILIS